MSISKGDTVRWKYLDINNNEVLADDVLPINKNVFMSLHGELGIVHISEPKHDHYLVDFMDNKGLHHLRVGCTGARLELVRRYDEQEL